MPEVDSRECLCRGLGPKATAAIRPEHFGKTGEHFRNAGLELLKGLRAIIDEQITRMSQTEKKGASVPVE